MRHALFFPPFGELAEPARVIEAARAADAAGWDGLFLWDHVLRRPEEVVELADAWTLLSAIGAATERLVLGPMVTPLSRRRPHKVARETVTLDRLTGGRLVLGVGLGVDTGGELTRFGEETDEVRRGDRLDESLEVLTALWSGELVAHRGTHFVADHVRFQPTPMRPAGVPIWCAVRGAGRPRTHRRIARFEGVFPVSSTLEQLDELLASLAGLRDLQGFDVAFEIGRGGDLAALAARGVTWAMWRFDPGVSAEELMRAAGGGPADLAGAWGVAGNVERATNVVHR